MTIHKKPPKSERQEPNEAREGYLERDLMSFAERDEMASLARAYFDQIRIISASRHHATVYIMDGDGSATVWKCLETKGEFELQKTKRGEGPLLFKSRDLYRFAILRCKEAMLANRMAHTTRNAKAAAHPGPRKRKQIEKRRARAAQHTLPFLELHTSSKTTT